MNRCMKPSGRERDRIFSCNYYDLWYPSVLLNQVPCFFVFKVRRPWCKIGDRVFYSKYAGKMLIDAKDSDNVVLVLNDEDIHCLILEDDKEEILDDGHQ